MDHSCITRSSVSYRSHRHAHLPPVEMKMLLLEEVAYGYRSDCAVPKAARDLLVLIDGSRGAGSPSGCVFSASILEDDVGSSGSASSVSSLKIEVECPLSLDSIPVDSREILAVLLQTVT